MRSREQPEWQQAKLSNGNAYVKTMLVLDAINPTFPMFRGRSANIEQRLGTIDRILYAQIARMLTDADSGRREITGSVTRLTATPG